MLVYCDYIMHRIRSELLVAMSDYMAPVQISNVGPTQFDVDETGAFVSPKKTLMVKIGEKAYRVTVEEA
jgi:hypothetical protein